ncbi:restriction endonuclease subunit S [Mameliella alba]
MIEPYASMPLIAPNHIESGTGRILEIESARDQGAISGKYQYEKGAVLYSKIRPALAKVAVAPEAGLCSADMYPLDGGSYFAPTFLAYVLLHPGFTAWAVLESDRVAMPKINREKLNERRLPLPPLPEQRAIAGFLDRETAKIDALVEEQRRLIALLKEKRQAVISHAVTKGLDPAAPMKPSGIDWLGDIPAHWEARSINALSNKITNGYVGPTRDILVEVGVRYLQSLHIKRNEIRFERPYFVTPEWSSDHAKSILQIEDVLIVQTGDIGQVAVVTEEFAGCNCHALIIVAPDLTQISGRWLTWVLASQYGQNMLHSIKTGALHPHLNCGNVKFVVCPVPPLEEQEQVIAYLEQTLGRFDALQAEAERAITLLQERRSALISAAVTGKIDVRDTTSNSTEAA